MTLVERKQALVNQLNQLKAQEAEVKQSLAQIEMACRRLEGALLLIAEMQQEDTTNNASTPATPLGS